jgi:transglutaminase-like putative cysteine protease
VPDLRERLPYPRAGWLGFGLLLVMALTVAWSVQGAGWLEQLEFLVPVAGWAVVTGTVLGMLRLSILVTLPLGSIIGVVIVVWAVGGEYFPGIGQVDRLMALHLEFIEWLRIVVQTGYPPQMSPYAVGLGALMFATAFMAAYTLYRHHRVLDAIVLLGAAIIGNMSATFTDLFAHLLLFVIAALLLWLRATLADRQEAWQRRRVSENIEVPEAILRSGVIFAAGSVALAWILTTVAVAAPLTQAWRGLDGVWTGVRDELEGVFGSLTNPESRISGSSFGPSFTVAGQWITSDDEALVLRARRPLYLRTTTYDLYTGRGWSRTEGPRRTVAATERLFTVSTTERPTEEESVVVERIEIEMRQSIGRNLFSAGSPLGFLVPSAVIESGGHPVLGGIEQVESLDEGDSYQVQVALSIATKAQLGTAGRDYPPEIGALYLATPGLTDRVRELAEEVTAQAENDYERAELLAAYLKNDPSFTYSTDGPVTPEGQDLVDFFLFDPAANRSGYCEYYASAMVLMARALDLPARVAVGFAPGARQADGSFLVRESSAHAWAEIYFPGYGWQIFEATPSIDPRFVRSSGTTGTAVRPPATGVDPLLDYDIFRESGDAEIGSLPLPSNLPNPNQPVPVESSGQERSGNALLIALLVLAGLVVVWWRMRSVQRGWRLMPAGDRAWRQLTAAAERAGIGQRPSETIYEYSGWLEEQLPRQGEPIRTVADSKVWQSYSGRRLTMAATNRLDAAMAKLRMPMIRLAVRHWVRRLTRREPEH